MLPGSCALFRSTSGSRFHLSVFSECWLYTWTSVETTVGCPMGVRMTVWLRNTTLGGLDCTLEVRVI